MAAFSHLDRPKLSTTATGSYELFSNPAMKWGTSSIGTAPDAPITYSFSSGRDGTSLSNNNTATTQITDDIYRSEVERAFRTWESLSNLQFAMAEDGSDADIDLYFAEIDGSGSVLATAWNNFTNSGSPGTVETIISAEIEFDEFEMSIANAQRFYLVSVHEIGHVLGLEHVDDNTQIMYEFYNDTLDGPQDGDIAGIHELYGVPSSFTSRVSTGAATDDQITRASETIDLTVFAGSGDDTIRSGLGDDSLFGGIGDDIAIAGAGRDMIFDAFGNDTVFGDHGDDSIYAPGGRNVLSGGTGNDALRGGIGNDRLDGGDGNDALIGDDQTASSLWFGDDTLIGGTGNDSMEGGRGQDVFVFAPNEGSDQIGRLAFNETTGFSLLSNTADFTPGQDKIDVIAFSFVSADQVLSSLSSTSQGTRFSASNTEVLLRDVSIESLTIEDFLW